jgi:CO/xanthine dehydrogenase FAD-binding subunit
MIKEYFRAKSIDEAVQIIEGNAANVRPMGGGTKLNIEKGEALSVVDLQDLGFDQIVKKGSTITIGATVSLSALSLNDQIPADLIKAIKLQDNQNLRNVSTVAGTLISAGSRSAFSTAMLALDAQFNWAPGNMVQSYGEYLPVRSAPKNGQITSEISFSGNTKLAFEYVARTPADLPIVSVAIGKWGSGRTRIVLGGYGKAPMMVLDGQEQGGAMPVIEAAFTTATDQWGSAEYRVKTAQILAQRCLAKLASKE